MVIRNSKFVCLVCGDEHPITMPITTKEMIKKIDAFIALHKGCPVSGANVQPALRRAGNRITNV